MKLSIIIPSFNRAQLLRRGLQSWTRQIISCSYEILVLNDYLPNDGTEEICKEFKDKLNIKYFFTGQRNTPGDIKWRAPGFVYNIGVKQARGKYIILSSPEIYLIENDIIIQTLKSLFEKPKTLVIPHGSDDNNREYLTILESGKEIEIEEYNKFYHALRTQMPFFMGMKRKDFISIGGYDEDFIGFAYDDCDFVERLKADNYEYYQIFSHIIHLYHSRKKCDRIGLKNYQEQHRHNRNLYDSRRGIIIRNENREWGKSNEIKPFKLFKLLKKNKYNKIENKWHLKRIPKIAHFYWGEEKLPFLRYLTIYSFHKYNPDWEIRFYYPKYRQTKREWNSPEHRYKIKIKKDYFRKLKKLPISFIELDFKSLDLSNDLTEIHKSDYLRWFLLNNVGGLWSDMDIIYIDSMNHIHFNNNNNKNIDTLICYHLPWKHSIGFLLSSQNNEYYETLWKHAQHHKYDPVNYQVVGSLLINSLMKSPDKIQTQFPKLKIGNISMDTVYSYNSSMIKILHTNNLNYVSRETIGIHWYAGHINSGTFVNKITEKNYDEINNVVAKITDASLNNKKEEIIQSHEVLNPIKSTKKKSLTIQSVIKNEPFIYYSIKSIYNYADKILLYDTGSNDKHTLEDIQKLLEEDVEHKITFKQIPLGFNEELWSLKNLKLFIKKHKGKMSVGKVRQIQLDDTDTEFFMIVDGDEVHYKATMETIINDILPKLSNDIVGVNIPLFWFCDMQHTFALNATGRIWRTDEVVMDDVSPNEAHCFKDTGKPIKSTDERYLIYKDIHPYAHFETFLKPWRRTPDPAKIIEFKDKLPEVMEENPYYIDRYLKEREKNK